MMRILTLAAVGLGVQGGAAVAAGATSSDFLWTAPLIIGAAFLIAWGAEAAQFMISQGLALAMLAWLQTLPEFAVEAELAWNAARDPTGEGVHLVTANFTGSIRLLMGFGMPIVFFIHFLTRKDRTRRSVDLDPFHSVEVVSLFPPVIYFFFIVYRGKLDLLDSVVLLGFYFMYMGLLLKMPPEEEGESIEELPWVARKILKRGKIARVAGVTLVFMMGGAILYLCVHPFVESMKAVSLKMGLPTFIIMQWIAPFLSEFPEKLSAFNWARQPGKAKLGLMNFLSSNVNQMTMLVAMIPIVFALSGKAVRPVVFDEFQKEEVLLTGCQAALCMVLLFNMKFEWWDAVGMFVLWGAQAVYPSLRDEMVWVYLSWIAAEIFLAMIGARKWSFPLRIGKDTTRRGETSRRVNPRNT